MLNNVTLMGRLVADPELRTTPNGISVTSFVIAVDRSYARTNEERKTDFIDLVAWRSTAEFITKYFKKGSMIAVKGSLQTRLYEDKNGNKRKAVEVVVDNAYFCGSKASGNTEYTAPSAPAPSYQSGDADDFTEVLPAEDDLPF
ncbi:MAG TPA: single-stranded DNA-binding protein [Clostridiales bacterium]|jgi:single-strand DNA-binding protein|nr:single-stranded DNA-binding protein [Clostridiales bacterium]HPP68190.1 single-stranded DNA-binding protein [Clostridiales bacterium]HQA04774.1 single-stranded DNA-binding protein [Clostridiales bacterium]HQD72833.1 single-stranded DNA-binding protein [Clostridiales bacterium]